MDEFQRKGRKFRVSVPMQAGFNKVVFKFFGDRRLDEGLTLHHTTVLS